VRGEVDSRFSIGESVSDVRCLVGDGITLLARDWSSNRVVMTRPQHKGWAAASDVRAVEVGFPRRSGGQSAALLGEPDCGPVDERVERPLVDKLLDHAAKRRICVVIGAAGWGKTTAVATWSASRPRAWLRYEDHEGDPDRLLSTLLHALRAQVSLPAPIRGPAAVDPGRVGSSVAALCAWLHSSLNKDLVVVLDDLQGLPRGSDAVGVVEALCQRAPQRLHLVLICRGELPFFFAAAAGSGCGRGDSGIGAGFWRV
jgi:hypothetical protein